MTKLFTFHSTIFSPEENKVLTKKETSLSKDPEDRKWDHFREDLLFHVFHVNLHNIIEARRSQINKWNRVDELFWYSHQQILRRFQIWYYTCYLLLTPLHY